MTAVGHVRYVLDPVLVLERLPDLVGQLARDLDGVHAADVAVEALPLCDPRAGRVGERDEALEDLRRAALDLVLRAGEVQELFAVGASLVAEALNDRMSACVASARARHAIKAQRLLSGATG